MSVRWRNSCRRLSPTCSIVRRAPVGCARILSRLVAMTQTTRVILELGKKRKVVAGAMDWPGLDRWGTSEDNALEKLLSYVPRYAGVAERAGLDKSFARARDVEVVERVPGSSSTDFWGIAHVPSEIEREVLSAV